MLDFVGDAGHRLRWTVPDDTGAADPALAAALAAYAEDPAREPDVLAALAEARLLVPVVAELGESEVGPDGLAHDKSSDMAAVLMRGPDGRLALLAFTGLERCSAGTRTRGRCRCPRVRRPSRPCRTAPRRC